MSLSPKQLDFLCNSNSSFNIASGAVSSGKTFIMNLRWLKHIYDAPENCLLLMSGKTHESLYDNVIRDLIAMDTINDIIYTNSPQRLYIKSKNIEIACADASNEKSWGKIQGKTVAGWYADEVTRQPQSFVKMAQSRCRHNGRVWPKFWTCNPEFPDHYIKTEYIDNENIDIKYWHFVLNDNPVLTEEYKNELKNSFHGVYKQRYIDGLWVLAEGLVYSNFNAEYHKQHFEHKGEAYKYIIGGQDWGWTHNGVFLIIGIRHTGKIDIIDEIVKNKTPIVKPTSDYEGETWVDLVKENILKYPYFSMGKERYCDIVYCGVDEPEHINDYQINGVNAQGCNNEVKAGIAFCDSLLYLGEKKQSIIRIHPRCINLLNNLASQQWRKDKEGGEEERPQSGSGSNDFDSNDAFRYGLFSAKGTYIDF